MSATEHGFEIEVPWAETITSYDKAHLTLYIQILDASAAGASLEKIAAEILEIDPQREPDKASKAASSHLRRAHWMTTHGYRLLLT